MLKANSAWFAGIPRDEKRKREELVLSNKILLDILAEMLYNMQEKKKDTVLGDYDSPSWSHKQAHLNGEIEAIKQIIEIVTIKERDDNPLN
jgi:hypothetical protein